MVPDITVIVPGDVTTGALNHDHFLNSFHLRVGQGFINVLFQRNRFTATTTLIGGNHHTGIRVDNTTGDRIRRETTEHNRVHRTDTGTGQHRNRRFRNHRHVDSYDVALANTLGFQSVSELTDAGVQVTVGDLLILLRIVTFPDDGDLVTTGIQMTVQTVHTGVQSAVFEPFDIHIVRVKAHIFNFAVRLHPVDALTVLRPKYVRLLNRLFVHLFVLGFVHQSVSRNVCLNRIYFLLFAHLNLASVPLRRRNPGALFL